jgi:flagellar basal body rod protein FlgC
MVDGISSSLTGMQNAISRVSTTAKNIANASTNGGANVSGDLVESKIASVQYEANVKVLKAQFEMEKRIIDMLA